MKPLIIAHSLVMNEERFVWYSLNSVLPYVDHVLCYDFGSTDRTIEIIKSIKNPKLVFKSLKHTNPSKYLDARNQLFKETPRKFVWAMVLDGDEVWKKSEIQKVTTFIRTNPDIESVVVRTNNLVGDIYHKLPESAGHYRLAGHFGHLNLRFMNIKRIPGLHVEKPHGQQGYYDSDGKPIQDRDPSKVVFVDVSYHHATHLDRSTNLEEDRKVIKRANKKKFELGVRMREEDIPEVFFFPRPKIVPDVTKEAPIQFWIKATIQTMPRKIKRKLIPPQEGY